MNSEDNSKANKKKLTREETRQLIRIAQKDGWTQEEIRKACRVSQSIVSGWKNGKTKASEHQVQHLLELYGSRLRRTAFKLYWQVNSEAPEDIQYFRVEGKIILSVIHYDTARLNRIEKQYPRKKLVVHSQGKGLFVVVFMERTRDFSTDEEACWIAEYTNPVPMNELLDIFDRYKKHLEDERINVSDVHTLPYLLRKALMNHGFTVPGIAEVHAN